MKVSTIKWIDRRCGTLVCRVLSIWNSLLPSTALKQESKKVLFIKLIEQGASVLAYSALKEAVNRLGKENVYFLVFEENRPILDFLNVLEPKNIIVLRNHRFSDFLIDSVRALMWIRKRKIDSCIDMEFFSRASAIFAYLSGAKKRVGLHSFTSEHPYRGNLINYRIHYNPYVHVAQYYLMLVKALKEEASTDPLLKHELSNYKAESPQVSFKEEDLKLVRAKLGAKAAYDKMVVLNPNASDMLPLRKWDEANFRTLAKKIEQKFSNTLIVFTGIEKERGTIDSLISDLKLDTVINLAGKTTLQELMALYQLSDLVVTNDSGPAHFASMFKTSIVVLFGPETPQLFAPLGPNVECVYKKLACSPCVNAFNHRFSPCTDNICMQSITVNEVFEKVDKVLINE